MPPSSFCCRRTAMALIMTLVALAGNYWILHLIFGNVALDVMESARIYFFIMAFSYPFLAIYNSCAAIFRSMGNSRISMLASLFMNLVNICGNALLVYGLHMGAAGVAIPSLVSRMLAAGMLLILLRNPRLEVSLRTYTLRFNFSIIKKLLAIGVPSSVENSIFQIGKLLVLSVVAGFGTSATTANAVSNSLAQFPLIPASRHRHRHDYHYRSVHGRGGLRSGSFLYQKTDPAGPWNPGSHQSFHDCGLPPSS